MTKGKLLLLSSHHFPYKDTRVRWADVWIATTVKPGRTRLRLAPTLIGLDDLLDDRPIAAATESSIEVDEMDPLSALVSPLVRRVDRVAIARFGAGLTLGEPHRLASCDVHRRKEREGGNRRELAH